MKKQVAKNLSVHEKVPAAAVREKSGFFTAGRFIENQNEWEGVRFGLSTMKYSGCEIMASASTQDWQYCWQEITITLPAEWRNLCVIQENPKGFSIFQKASYEADKDGYICRLSQRPFSYLQIRKSAF